MLERMRVSIFDRFRRKAFAKTDPRPHASTKSSSDSSSRYISECEALRGIAILLVVLFHAYLQIAKQSPLRPNMLNAFIMAGNTGVTLFFVLSAFLLNLPLMAGKPISPRRFFINRALRILPMYCFVVLVAGLYHQDAIRALKSLLFLDINLSTLWPFGSVWWSLAAEVQFYLLLPILHYLWRHRSWRWLLLPIFITACFLYFDITRTTTGNYYFINSARDSFLALWPTFACGAILAAIHAQHGAAIKKYCSQSGALKYGGADLILLAVIFFLADTLLEVAHLGPINSYLLHFDHVFVEAVGWSCLIAIVLYLPAKAKIVICNPALIFLGLISYSLYLLHFPIIFFGQRYLSQTPYIASNFSTTEIIIASVAIGLIVSTITYHLIEKPMLNLKERIKSKTN